MCRCAERRAVLRRALAAASAGDVSAIAPAVAHSLRTASEDAGLAVRRAAARLRLAR